MKFLLLFSLFVVTLLPLNPMLDGAETAAATPVQLKWLGTAGWEIRVADVVILVDPFLTRREAAAGVEWKTNEEEVNRIITKADFIFAGHSHADHIADIPVIAKRFGAKVIGSRTTTNIALTAGIDKAQLMTIRGGEKLEFNDFSVQVIESQHGVLNRGGRRRQPKPEEVLRPWSGAINGDAFVEGGSYLYYFSFGGLRLLHQSTGNFIEENLTGLQPDVAILAENGNYHWNDALKILRPKTVIIHHYDEWRTPFTDGIPDSNRRRAQRFERLIKSWNKQVKVIIPELLEPFDLPQ
ncbi:MAG TPA: MBL fold metallo-hydrolase [Candidatus Limnocylindrales bacterium]|nr:MBL fold metallo-hydrolase [Candidatus Limnocylindrales bacterium]